MVVIPKGIDLKKDKAESMGDISGALKLAEGYIALCKEIDGMEAALAEKNEEKHRMESVDLPEALDALNAKQLPLLNGGILKIKDITKCSLPSQSSIEKQKDPSKKSELESNLAEGMAWLRDPDVGGEPLIKNFLMLEFEKGHDNIVGDFVGMAEEHGLPFMKETSVHAATLEKFIKTKIAAGVAIPKAFSVYTGRKAVIEMPKAKKEPKEKSASK